MLASVVLLSRLCVYGIVSAIEDNGSADLVETPTFWPRGVRCRPCLDRNERYHNHNKTHSYHRRTPYVPRVRHAFGRSDVNDYNPFSPLRDQGNYHNTRTY